MYRKRFSDAEDVADFGRGPYDADPLDEGDAWFLPGVEEDDPNLTPLPRADRAPLVDPGEWLLAEREQGARLADLAFRLGQLDARLRGAPKGALARLALAEAEELSWWCGDRVTQDRLVLWVEMSLGGVQEDNAGLLRASWAWRRLTAGPGPGQGGWAKGLPEFLGRDGGGTVADLADMMGQAGMLHPLTRGALLFHGWRLAGPGGPAGDLEAAVMAARVAADMGAGPAGASFLPVGLAGFTAHRAGTSVEERLGAWIASAERAVLAALMRLDRLRDWQAAARTALADLQGRTPPLLVDLFAELPIVTAPLAEARTGAGRATVQRNLALMQARGLTREMTGQGRYRVWTAKL
jgi:hypothetical protein